MSTGLMRAMTCDGKGTLTLSKTVPKPSPTSNQILVEVFSSGINRIDTYMMNGAMGVIPILGMEISGIITELGPECESNLKVGDAVIALVSDSGHAEFAVVDERHALLKPQTMTFSQAAALPEQWFTAFQLLHLVGEVKKGDRVLIHAGSSGVGTAAIQLCRLVGAIPYVTAGSSDKITKCKNLGAEDGFNYKDTEKHWSKSLMESTDNKGVDIVLDCIGGSHVDGNLDVLTTDSRWVLYGLMGGKSLATGENFLGRVMGKRISLKSTTLRARSYEYKANLISRFANEALPLFKPQGSGALLEVQIDSIFTLEQTAEAYERLVANANFGKIVIVIKDEPQECHD